MSQRHPLRLTWRTMIWRCTSPGREEFARYGAIGISVCDRWMDFDLFVQDVGDRPEGHTLDRIDPYGHYEPGNVRWASASIQSSNKRKGGAVLPAIGCGICIEKRKLLIRRYEVGTGVKSTNNKAKLRLIRKEILSRHALGLKPQTIARRMRLPYSAVDAVLSHASLGPGKVAA